MPLNLAGEDARGTLDGSGVVAYFEASDSIVVHDSPDLRVDGLPVGTLGALYSSADQRPNPGG